MPRATQSHADACRFATQRAFESWLRKNHATSDGIWLLIARPGSEASTVTYPQAVEVALCFGWIDGQKKALDDQHWLQRFTPRRPSSVWSKTNRTKAEALIQSGRMQPSGMAAIERARANGRWETAYDGARTAGVPADLQEALDRQPGACTFFAQLNAANRYAVLWRVQTAKRPETRSRRIETLVAMLSRGEKIHG
ncbi:YdeI/OmpD-associated family protein [Ramlibacter sp. MMS24-I3-19]|uniref:YdeI/OmpD-associated family protein n=1 Tax=Ramlibacter sp. MMS24-I3-19 TaxID=3416606 RepID=UPI003D02E197